MGKRSIDLEVVNGQVIPPFLGNGSGGAVASRGDARGACSRQDQLVTVGRRILAATGIQGSPQFSIPNGTDPNGGSQVYPGKTFERTRLVVGQRLTPGCRLRVEALVLPAGPNSTTTGIGSWWSDGRYGSLIVEVEYTNGINSYDREVEMAAPSSGEANGAEPTAFHPLGIRVLNATIEHPANVEDAPAFSGEVDVTISIVMKGSLRLIDACVYEVPYELHHDDTHREGAVHLAQGTYPSEYALTGANLPTDARWGARQCLKTVHDQRQLWGPALMQWSSWDESTAGVTDAEPDPLVISSTSFVGIPYSSITTYSESNPGWSVSSGGTARCAEWSGILELREGVGCIPVVVRVYARVAATGDVGIIRFQSAPHSYADIRVTATTYGWVEGLWWMACPIHSNILSVLQIFARVQASDQVWIRYMSIHYGGHAQLQQ
ncbi:hypothetical protein [Nannocystis sp. SCPEA4]|uniref:hypothetical protein n=1 Tax=Nannocystis sp. SCPEA4 TaxID=2996787 RepID=UPI002271BB1F|nr:hypothetical protein [Nannocystis sp. SCPEA4]MCY1055444.1 hypothetical protein [Nannocystis sp. SCPEA4]